MMVKIKLVGFDWDGTLARMPVRYSWTLIDRALESEKEQAKLTKLYFDGRIDYLTWSRLCIKRYKEFGLTKTKLHKIMKDGIEMHEGSVYAINRLKTLGIKTCIISGGIYDMYEYASSRFNFSVDYTSFTAKFVFGRNGDLKGAVYKDYDYKRKIIALRLFCRKAGASLSDVLYVGDSENDVDVFKACRGVAFNQDSEELKKYAKIVLEKKDMRKLLDYID